MSVFERRRLLEGLLKIELEIAAVANGCLIIYSPEVDAYLAIPQSVFGIESDLKAQMLMGGSIVSPDVVLQAWTSEAEELSMDGVLTFADATSTGGVLEIPYTIGDGLASTASGELLKYLGGIVTSILEITSTVGKRRAQARRGKVVAEMVCSAAITTTIQYTTTENDAGGLTYAITADAYEETDGVYVIGGRDGSQ